MALLASGLSLYDAVVHAFTVVSTGGLSTYDDSIGHFDSVQVEMVVAGLMLIGGTSFTLHWRAVTGRPGAYWRSPLFRWYVAIFVTATVVITVLLLAVAAECTGVLVSAGDTLAGTGIDPAHLEAGEVTDTFRSWWANAVYTVPFRDGRITWDLLPGFMVNLNKDQSGETAWGMTWSSRLAVYKIIPSSAIVGEAFGTTGEAYAEPTYRIGIRWESPRVIVAGTYGDSFSGDGSPRFEIGIMHLTNQLEFLCIGKCRRDPDW